jgi:hypothetical protein
LGIATSFTGSDYNHQPESPGCVYQQFAEGASGMREMLIELCQSIFYYKKKIKGRFEEAILSWPCTRGADHLDRISAIGWV